MSVPNQTPYIIYNANGLTTVFPFEFYIISASDVQVTLNGEIVTSGYSVSGVGNVAGGDVIFLSPPASGTVVMLERVVPTYRLTEYQDNGDLLADTVNKDFDRLWMAIQRSFIYLGLALRRPLLGGPFDAQGYRISKGGDPVDKQDFATKNYVDNVSLVRALRVPEAFVSPLPAIEQRKNKIVAMDNSGNPLMVLPESGSAADVMIELAKPTGAGGIGTTSGQTVQQELDARVVSLNSIKSLVDLPSASRVQGLIYDVATFYDSYPLGGGFFQWDATKSKGDHDGWMIIDPSIPWSGNPSDISTYLTASGSGSGCFVRVFDGTATPEMAGAISDWNGTTGTDISPSVQALINNDEVIQIKGSGRTYWFGQFTASEVRFHITRFIKMDWGWSTLLAKGEASLADYAASLFSFEDVSCDISNYIFNDLTFSFTIDGRGIQPVTILSNLKSTKGFAIGPCHIENGQSLVTIAGIGDLNNRSSGITLRGPVTANKVYYGVNCANNGDDLVGTYRIEEVNRAIFVYGAQNINVDFYARYSWPASASIYLAQYGNSVKSTSRIKIRGAFNEINGPVLIADNYTTNGNGTYRDIDIDVFFDVLGSNILPSAPVVRMGCYDPENQSTLITNTTQSVTTERINISVNPGPSVPSLTVPIRIYTPSPNHGLWSIGDKTPLEITSVMPVDSSNKFGTPVIKYGNRLLKCVHGNLTSTGRVISIPANYIVGRPSTAAFEMQLYLTATNGVDSTFPKRSESFIVLGYIDSSGNITLNQATSIGLSQYGTATAFSISVSPDFKYINITANAYTSASSRLVAYWNLMV
ncbi:phage tail fiber protein [Citrobacter amalonaticus]|nr:hypothetical protein [Citrobacter amalonaticus]